jgi:plasmid stabilization system protein ParE
MSAYVISPSALEDLQEIWDFIAADNVHAADQLQDEFFEAFDELSRRPGIGHARQDLTNRQVRFWPVGSYLIVYREIPGRIQIVAIFHGARDIPKEIAGR